jgi:hypothetical protein
MAAFSGDAAALGTFNCDVERFPAGVEGTVVLSSRNANRLSSMN